ncbi:MAG TPA: glycoside hydrolase domain-containing protein [Ruminiclostridium sp.]
MELWTDDSYNRNFKTTLKPSNSSTIIVLDSARNEYESAQILMRSDKNFEIKGISFLNLISSEDSIVNSFIKYNFQDYIYFNDGINYPDPLSNSMSIATGKNETQGIWITVYVPKKASAGEYTGKITIHTTEGDFKVDLELNVYSVTIPDSKEGEFNLEYWSFFPGTWYRDYSEADYVKNYYGYIKYSKEWWELIDKAAQNMQEHRCNTLLVRSQDLLLNAGTFIGEDGKYSFNWTLFDKYIQRFIDKDVVKRLVGFQLLEQFSVDHVHVLKRDSDGNTKIVNEPVGSEYAENWLDQYLSALKSHLEEKGWLNIWMQHIADEPNHNPESWIATREKVKKYLPGVKCSEPLDTTTLNGELIDHIDLWVPRIEQFDENVDFFDERKKAGDDVWVYTCCEPSDECFLNKFVDRPYWHSRLLSWGCFKYGLNGFLHWGYNYWDAEDTNFGLNPDACSKGDGFIVYPDPANNNIKNSVRLIATRDGIEDFELFKILERKDPILASKIVNSVFTNFSYYSGNTKVMREKRKELLKAVSIDTYKLQVNTNKPEIITAFNEIISTGDIITKDGVSVTMSSSVLPASQSWYDSPKEIPNKLFPKNKLDITYEGTSAEVTTIKVDDSKEYQSILGVGISIEGSTIANLNKLSSTVKNEFLKKLVDPTIGAGMSLLRVTIGTSDFTADVFHTYDDMISGNRDDENLSHFSIQSDIDDGTIDTLKEIIGLNLNVKLFASSWTPPGWMKEETSSSKSFNNNDGLLLRGGKLSDAHIDDLALYYTRYLEEYAKLGISIYAITFQNEPTLEIDYPSCAITSKQERLLSLAIKKCISKSSILKAKNVSPKIWAFDHNFDGAASYVPQILDNENAVDGVAFHSYGGVPEAMTQIHNLYPNAAIHLTERSLWGTKGADEIANYFRNYAQSYTAWVTMLDSNLSPMQWVGTPGPTMFVRDANTPDKYWACPEYYIEGQFSKFIRPGSVRIDSNYGSKDTVTNVSFKNTDGSIAIVVINQTDNDQTFKILNQGTQILATIPAQNVATYQWTPHTSIAMNLDSTLVAK